MMKRTDKAEKISITFPPDMLSLIKEKVKDGDYASTSEVIREAMRLWQKKEEEHHARLSVLRARLEHSAQSGVPVSMDQAFDTLEQIHKQRMKAAGNETV